MAQIKLKEGMVFLVPIDNFFIVGLVTRVSSLKNPFGYFYKTKFQEIPKLEKLDLSSETEIIYKAKFGIQGFKKQTWQIIGQLANFEKQNWPLPVFYNKSDSMPGELVYLDDNLDIFKRQIAQLDQECYKDFPDLGLGGSGYIEKKLAKLLLEK